MNNIIKPKIDWKGIAPEKPKEKNYPFWKSEKKISAARLVSFLGEEGFAQYQGEESRLSKTLYIKNDAGVLQLHSAESMKKWIIEKVSKDTDSFDLETNDDWHLFNKQIDRRTIKVFFIFKYFLMF